jgi:hypothetical protein
MISRWLRAACLLALAPAAALAFETVDTLPWPSSGRFPAYSVPPPAPWDLWAYAGFMHDSNVLRRQTDERSDTIMRYGAGIRGTALVYGRQRLLLEAVGEYYDYIDLNALDHFAYAARAEWLWELGNQLAGTAGYRRIHRLADPAESGRATRAMITEDRLHAGGAYTFTPDWRLTGGVEWGNVSRDGPTLGETQTITTRGGIEHFSPLGNVIGLEVRRTTGDAPVSEELGLGAFPNNQLDHKEVAALIAYNFGAQLRATGRVGHAQRSYSELQGRDFNGTTYRGGVEWHPGTKTLLVFEVFREPTAIIDATALHVLRRGTAFGPSWAPTVKLVFSARFVNERRIFQGDPAVESGAILRDETLRVIRLGAGWEPQRRWQLSAALDRGTRESNVLGRDFDFTAFVLNLRFTY